MTLHTPHSWIRVTHENRRAVIQFAPGTRLDEVNTEDFSHTVERLIDERDRPEVVIDMTGVSLIGSLALAKLVALSKRAEDVGSRLTLTNLGPTIQLVFEVTKLNTVLNIATAHSS